MTAAEAVQAFLRETYGTQSWLSRWLSPRRTFEVGDIVPFEDAGFFRRASVFRAYVRDRVLEALVLPSGGSVGLFSLDQSGLRYLNHCQDNVEALLRGEARNLAECKPSVLALLVAEALGQRGNSSHDVLESPEHLATYQGGRIHGGYEVDARERERVHPRLVAPTLSGDTAAGWRLEFCSVFGWMHDKQTLVRHQCRFSPDFRIQYEREVLSRRIFERTPMVRY